MSSPQDTNAAKDMLTEVDFERDAGQLHKAHLGFKRRIEKEAAERVEKALRIKRRNFITGGLLAVGVISIYAYTLWATKSESFLEDIDREVHQTQKSNIKNTT